MVVWEIVQGRRLVPWSGTVANDLAFIRYNFIILYYILLIIVDSVTSWGNILLAKVKLSDNRPI